MQATALKTVPADVVSLHIRHHISEVQRCTDLMPQDVLGEIVQVLVQACHDGRQVFIFGNGGSASTASHFACDLGKGAALPDKRRLRVMSLNDNVALMTAISNDISYEMVFKEQLINVLNPGDVIIGISASGNSPNVVRAFEYAREVGASTIGLIGFGGGKMKALSDHSVIIDSWDYGVVEGLHLVLEHLIAQGVRRQLIVDHGLEGQVK